MRTFFVHQTGVLSAIALGALACSRADHDDPCFHEDSSPLLVRLLTSYEVMVVVVTWVFFYRDHMLTSSLVLFRVAAAFGD